MGQRGSEFPANLWKGVGLTLKSQGVHRLEISKGPRIDCDRYRILDGLPGPIAMALPTLPLQDFCLLVLADPNMTTAVGTGKRAGPQQRRLRGGGDVEYAVRRWRSTLGATSISPTR